MKINYDEVYQVELINELSWGIYGLFVTELQNRNIDLEDTSIFEVKLLEELDTMSKIKLDDKNLEELARIKEYWETMSDLTQNIFKKQTIT